MQDFCSAIATNFSPKMNRNSVFNFFMYAPFFAYSKDDWSNYRINDMKSVQNMISKYLQNFEITTTYFMSLNGIFYES